jgi:cell division septation protein DedD
MVTAKPKTAKAIGAQPDRKVRKNTQNLAGAQITASPVQPETMVAAVSQPAPDLTAVLAAAEANSKPAPPVDLGSAATTSVDSNIKVAKLFVEVGTFKEETWANDAVDKLTQLGFHAVLVHKNMLWLQSFHVQVGPYSNPQELAEAQKSLAVHGFKSHPVS